MTDFDWEAHDSPLDALTHALEAATDDYVEACNRTAEAENAYKKLFHHVYLRLDVAVSAREKMADSDPDVGALKAQYRIAEAREKGCKAKVEEVKHRLMAAMSWQRVTSVGGI